MILGEEEKRSLDELAHHGVKGMHWGVRKGPTTSDIRSAQARHNDRIDRLDSEATRLSFAKSTTEKQRILNGIHDIANEKGAHEDATTAARLTRGEKFTTTVLSGGLATSLASRNMKKQGLEAHKRLDVYKNSKLSDYHDASR